MKKMYKVKYSTYTGEIRTALCYTESLRDAIIETMNRCNCESVIVKGVDK